MNKKALIALQRLRQFQLEQEEIKLQQRQTEELAQEKICHFSWEKKQQHAESLIQVEHAQELWMGEKMQRELTMGHELNVKQLGLCRQARFQQMVKTISAKQKVDMLERLLEHQNENEHHEFDRQERKMLDDFAQSRFVRAERNE